MKARFLEPLRPDYPAEERALGREGAVTLEVGVRADGKVTQLRVLASDGRAFTEAAARAVRETSFAPGRLDGSAVSSTVTVRVRFSLED